MKLILFCLSFLCLICGWSQWTPNTNLNTLVANSSSSDMKSLTTTTGKTAIVFWKVVSAPINYELRMQVLDINGQQMLGPDGVLVSNNMNMSTSTAIMRICTDSNENIYIGATGTNGGIAYAFKMNINGLAQWGTNGINLGSGYMITIKPLSNGEVIIARNSSNQILYQKYTANGTPVWPSVLQLSNGASNNKSPADIFELSNQEFVIVFHTFSFGVSSTLWAQKFSSAGIPIWNSPIQLSNKTTQWNTLYSSTQDQDVIYYGYKAATGTHFDSFLQRIEPNGTLPWGINGSDFDIGIVKNEMDTRIAYQNGSSVVWAICNYTNSAQSAQGVYIQKFNKLSGARLLSDTAKVIYPIGSSKVAAGDLLLFNDQPVFLMKDGFDNGATPTTLNACFLNSTGDFVWPSQYQTMATFLANKSRIHFSKLGNTQVVASFVEEKVSGLPRIYAQSQSILSNITTTQNVAVCDSFTWINNVTYTQSTNTPNVVLTSSTGVDSIIYLNLSILPSVFDTTQVTACGTYLWNGNTYTDSGIYIGQSANCVTQILNLNITIPVTDTIMVSACDDYFWENQLLTSSGIYSGLMSNCVIPVLNLTITPSTIDTAVIAACGSYEWNGQLYIQSGIYTGPTTNCMTPILNLTIDSVSNQISLLDMTLTAFQSTANTTYQWIDCNTNTPINNAIEQIYTANVSGIYAVIISEGSCTDTSNCIEVSDAGIQELNKVEIAVYPNPSEGILNVVSSQGPIGNYQVFDLQGRLLQAGSCLQEDLQINCSSLTNGSYMFYSEFQSIPINWVKH